MILTVALNAALDLTYHIDGSITPHRTHRVRRVDAAAGGKALNVARVLHTLDTPVLASGLLGGRTGEQIAERIPARLRHRFARLSDESRRAVVVADDGDATGFWEPGPAVTDAEWAAFVRLYEGLLRVSNGVVLSGSLPSGLPVTAYAQLVALARTASVPVVLDCDGAALAAALPERPDIVKPNAHELAQSVPDADVTTVDGVRAAARRLRDAGAVNVVASRGPAGLVALTEDGDFASAPPKVLSGNPTGAGDALVAGLARGWIYRSDWRSRLADAVALSAAAVRAPVAGRIEREDVLRFRHDVDIEEI